MLAFIVIGELWEIACEFLLEMKKINLKEQLSDCLIFLITVKQDCFCTIDIHIVNFEKCNDEDSSSSWNYWELMVS